MPATITTYHTFTAGTKARSSQVNSNFSNYRGDIVPINETTQTASDLTHNLGAPDHRWLRTYTDNIELTSSTTTAGLILRGDTSVTTGAFRFQINSTTVARVIAAGFDGTTIAPSTTAANIFTSLGFPTARLTDFTVDGTWTCPVGVSNAIVLGLGGGGGGGGGGGNQAQGGAGGCGSMPRILMVSVTPGNAYSITVGTAGPGGSCGASGVNGVSGQSGSSSYFNGTALRFYGAAGGSNGTTSAAGAGSCTAGYFWDNIGGNGGAPSAAGFAGRGSDYALGGAAGGAGGTASGGGGGGGALGNGGDGGTASTGAVQGGNGTAAGANSGAGGGGGGGSESAQKGGNGGNGGSGRIIVYAVYGT